MVNTRNNRDFSVHNGTAGRSSSAGRAGSDAAATSDLSEAARRLRPLRERSSSAARSQVSRRATSAERRAAGAASRAARTQASSGAPGTGRQGAPTAAPRATAAAAPRATAKNRTGRSSALMRYANDNRAVQAIHAMLTGPFRFAFLAAVIAAVVLGLYFPVRDLYIAHRTQTILTEQLAIRERYNERLQKQVESYTSNEGMEDAARKELGMVEQGERRIIVTGTDENGDPIMETESGGDASAETGDTGSAGGSGAGSSADEGSSAKSADAGAASGTAPSSSSEPQTSAEVERAMEAVYSHSPWYFKVLDTLFFFHGVDGQAVVSTGDAGSAGN